MALLLDKGSRHSRSSAKVLLGIERICGVYMRTGIATIGITTGIPKSPSGGSRSAGNGGSVSLEEVELIGWIFVDSTTDHHQKHEKKSSSDEDERDNGERCP